MTLPKLLGFMAIVLTLAIGYLAFTKPAKEVEVTSVRTDKVTSRSTPQEIIFTEEIIPAPAVKIPVSPPVVKEIPKEEKIEEPLPEGDHVADLFKKGSKFFKFIETVSYKSRADWQKGRPAWLSDYASHYETSRHFIARSLNGKPDYFKQDIAEGDKFNVFKKDVNLSFYLLIDASKCKMWLYGIDETNHEKNLIKSYQVCLGRKDSSKASGLLTPLGKYSLGNRIAIYKPKVMGHHNSKKVEMVRIFGSRWIPFEKEIGNVTAPAKGFGIHGVPWTEQGKELKQDKSSIGKYESDGCIRLSTEDMEELYAIIITKPSVVEIVNHFNEASLFK